MVLLVILTLIVLVTAIAVTSRIASRAEAVIAGSLVFNAILIVAIYALGFAGWLNRASLGVTVVLECAALLGLMALRHGVEVFDTLPRRLLALAVLPFVAISLAWKRRSLIAVGAVVATMTLPYMFLASYLAPAWRDWDGLWYHEPLIGLTIQNHGFAPEAMPVSLQVINGVHRLCEMTQLWFGMYGGRRVIEMANVFFMPLYAACVFALVRRYTKSVLTGIAWASALLLLPGYLRLVQSSLVDPQACALLLAAAYYVTHPKLDRRNAMLAILAMTLAAGAKIWSIVPIAWLSIFLLVRLVRRRRENGGLATAGLVTGGAFFVLGMQALTYVRNLVLFKNPVWPILSYDNPKLGIHWAGGMLPVDMEKSRGGIDFNEPFLVFYKKMLATPYSVTGPGHHWQINDYGFAWSWVVLPIMALAVLIIVVRWLSAFAAIRIFRVRSAGPDHEILASAMMLAVVAATSLFLSPAIFIARYHVASLGMLAGCVAFMVSRWRTSRFAEDVALIAAIGSIMMMAWTPVGARHSYVYLYEPAQLWKWMKTPYPRRELEDITVPEVAHPLQIAPANTSTALAREAELKRGTVIGYDNIDYMALLWNNDYSNKTMWLNGPDPLAQAEQAGATWVYARNGSRLSSQLVASTSWEAVGPLEAEGFGSAWRHKR